ncbi:DNA polymerase Y family protein [Massilia sp. CCM 8734]|uniref:Y-family DNA polymerase n=1 Tax=Massilia sp. CCM 8734 TaxID=2609283 RepID=UPI001423B35B|nr:DNA polymerase Y family protein [Massilia sp. CCM 8734]NHZ99109.1 DNA polymerase Y family protein [Massilia sp. CCM 8734]
MRCLISLYLPLLPLESLRPSWSEPGRYAVIDSGQVQVASTLAMADGVHPGMRVGGVAALSPATVMLERDLAREIAALEAIALAMMQYTPDVAYENDQGVLLDVGPSLRLFGGMRRLCSLVRHSVTRLGLTVVLAAAPTAGGAWLLARTPRKRSDILRRRCVRESTLRTLLDSLDCQLLPMTTPYRAWLHAIGVADLGGLRRLPRAGLLRRTSKAMVQELDRAYGDLQEMRKWIRPPAHFTAYVETFERVEHAEALMAGATGLILQMTGWLTAQQLAVSTFTLALEHERGRAAVAPTVLSITLAEPVWKEDHLLRLLKERLAKTELSAFVLGLKLDASQLHPMAPPTEDLFPEPGGSPEDFNRLLELLAARLGAENVLMPLQEPDHRPEVCNSWVPASARIRTGASRDPELLERPSLVLPKPIRLLVRNERPFYGSPLRIISGPERIEAGWWNDQTVARDYYVAQGEDASCFWIYLERTADAQWYLHGLYG